MALLVFLSASTPTPVVSPQIGRPLGLIGPSKEFAEESHHDSFLVPVPFVPESSLLVF
jgi:hypothetical protein